MRTARIAGVDAGKVWNLSVLSLFAALAAARLLLVIANFGALRRHPAWVLGLAMVHHPLLAGVGALAGGGCAAMYAHHSKLPLRATADALAPPLALGLAFEQAGALLAGASYGTDAGPGVPWAVTYSDPMAAIWSGTPLGIPLHPVQAYAALAFFSIAALLLTWLPLERRKGDVAGFWLIGAAVAIFLTELWRAPEGRGWLFKGTVDGPEIAAVAMVIAGGMILREPKSTPAPRQQAGQNRGPAGETRGNA
jgi:phosphatidylglycerol:prolipoprotein diacylglycerol transferase